MSLVRLVLLFIDGESNYDIHVRIIDSVGSYSDYRLALNVESSSSLKINFIQNITLVSPQSFSISYTDILSSSINYGLNSSISLVRADDNIIPSWMLENYDNYLLTVKTDFKIEETLKNYFKFKIVDYCGDAHYSNAFYVTILKNQHPIVVGTIPNSTFYEGQLNGTIPVPSPLFIDPGDTLIIETSLCLQVESQPIKATYKKDDNVIKVSFPPKFHAYWRIALVASDTGNLNFTLTLTILLTLISEN